MACSNTNQSSMITVDIHAIVTICCHLRNESQSRNIEIYSVDDPLSFNDYVLRTYISQISLFDRYAMITIFCHIRNESKY